MSVFGLNTNYQNSKLILLPVPWEATVTYEKGTSLGPQNIINESVQVDLYDYYTKNHQELVFDLEISKEIFDKSEKTQELAKKGLEDKSFIQKVNENCSQMNAWVKIQCEKLINENKFVGIIGGDHSVPLSLIELLGNKYNGDFGILHFDAHADLRDAYQGYNFSHASIMYNVLNLKNAPKKLVQVGIRDFCKEEFNLIQNKNTEKKIDIFISASIASRLFEGDTFKKITNEIIESLPQNVYISFDIDGLSPELCQNTGTPVPGGLSYEQAQYILYKLGQSGKKIIGFDLCEVGQTAFDGNVGARILFHLCNWTLITNMAN